MPPCARPVPTPSCSRTRWSTRSCSGWQTSARAPPCSLRTVSRIADPTLADAGEQRIAWVARHSPVLNRLARERLGDGSLEGRRVAVVVHLEAKTAYLATLFAEAGAHVVAAASNAMTTQDSVCAALVRRGIEVFAVRGASIREFEDDLLAAADFEPDIVVDD